jgi:hypothetical protein
MAFHPLYHAHQLAGDWVHAREWLETSRENLSIWTKHLVTTEANLDTATAAVTAYLRDPGHGDQVRYQDHQRRVHTLRVGDSGEILHTVQEGVKPETVPVLESLGLLGATPAYQIDALACLLRAYQTGELKPVTDDPSDHFHLIDDTEEPDSDGQ